MKKFFSSRQFLAAVIIILSALLIWFVGPLISLAEWHPLDSIASRITTILLVSVGILLWVLSWPLSIMGVLVLALLIWYAAPGLAFNHVHPFTEVWIRSLLITLLVLSYGIYGLYRLWQALRVNEHLLKKILHPRGEPVASEARADLRAITGIVTQAIRQLRQIHINVSGVRRLFGGKRYLYEIPWYMMVGAPGDGKTTAILNSGLQFPLEKQLGAQSLPGHGGTLHCDWWFTNDAVLIDTAGRYTRHDDAVTADSTSRNAGEWHGFLALLRKYRPRAPLNGVLLTLNVADIVGKTDAERLAAAAALRTRLAELRQELGIRFPVYFVITKMDLLPGFTEYFSSLTSEGRSQVWGFTLPYAVRQKHSDPGILRPACEHELSQLISRLELGIPHRLQEEYDIQRRLRLYHLPEEFAALKAPLLEYIERVFLDSKFDTTQLHNTLRGVYFTSAAQAPVTVVADRQSPLRRFWRAVTGDPELQQVLSRKANSTLTTGNRSYFLHDLFARLIFRESLVQPNRQWEWRHRLMRGAGHTALLVAGIALFYGMQTSFDNNQTWLTSISARTSDLNKAAQTYTRKPTMVAVPDILNAARSLTRYQDLDPATPPLSYRYGLYRGIPVLNTATKNYEALLDQLLLPVIARQVENALAQAVNNQNEKLTYDTLRIYLLLHLTDAQQDKFSADEILGWILNDWEQNDTAAAFGGRAAVIEHLESLFDGSRFIRSPFVKNETLIRQARALLDSNTSTERIYERAKLFMAADAPQDFTLVRAVGADAGILFTRASGGSLDQGVPGLFTRDGYRELFDKGLPSFVGQALLDDQWVMGRETSASNKNMSEWFTSLSDSSGKNERSLVSDIRRLYLSEYAQTWQTFLNDIRSINSDGADSSTSLAYDLQILRTLASPDSPLVRLLSAVVEQTTLVPPMDENKKKLAEQAEAKAPGNVRQASQTAKLLKNIRPEEQLEKKLVDDRFAALREVVTGKNSRQASSQGMRTLQLDAVLNMLNDYYSQLVVADQSLAANELPPKGQAGDKLRQEADKLPAPLKNILLDLTMQGSSKVSHSVGEVLNNQMEAVIGEECREAIEGKYPFADTQQEASTEDFNRIFAPRGVLDDFFTTHLAPLIDTASSPWRYKQSDNKIPIRGPELGDFQQAKKIRSVFFKEQTAKKMSWEMEMSVVEMDPNITELVINIDGQTLRYAHGPVTPLHIVWPGPRHGSMAEITASPRIKTDTSTLLTTGPWALFRLLDLGTSIETSARGSQLIEYDFDGRKVVMELTTGSDFNPVNRTLLTNFSCPMSRL